MCLSFEIRTLKSLLQWGENNYFFGIPEIVYGTCITGNKFISRGRIKLEKYTQIFEGVSHLNNSKIWETTCYSI